MMAAEPRTEGATPTGIWVETKVEMDAVPLCDVTVVVFRWLLARMATCLTDNLKKAVVLSAALAPLTSTRPISVVLLRLSVTSTFLVQSVVPTLLLLMPIFILMVLLPIRQDRRTKMIQRRSVVISVFLLPLIIILLVLMSVWDRRTKMIPRRSVIVALRV